MTTTGDDMRQLKDELRAILIGNGRTASDADEIVFVAAQAAREAVQRLIEVVGTVPEGNRDIAIILALNIVEKLMLSGYKLGKKPDQIDPLPRPCIG